MNYVSDNKLLQREAEKWINHNIHGVICIVSETGTGKSTFVKNICKRIDASFYVQGFDFMEWYASSILANRKTDIDMSALFAADTIFIDHMDLLENKIGTMQSVGQYLNELANEANNNRLIVCLFTFVDIARRFANLNSVRLIRLD